jgi:hypothetical protein
MGMHLPVIGGAAKRVGLELFDPGLVYEIARAIL